jgi:anti-sigma B factor antagonist
MPDGGLPVELVSGVPVVTAPEEIDIINVGQFRQALLASAACGAAITVVDLTRTRFCDSAGLHALVAAYKRARAAGRELRLVIPGASVLRVFAISGLDRVMACYGELGQALAQPGAHQPGAHQPGAAPQVAASRGQAT